MKPNNGKESSTNFTQKQSMQEKHGRLATNIYRNNI